MSTKTFSSKRQKKAQSKKLQKTVMSHAAAAAYNGLMEDVYLKYRICYQKTGNLKYISHLDMQRMFQRALRRAGIEIEYSKGFNPHPKLTYSPPLPLFAESLEEYIDLSSNNDINTDKLKKSLPEGIAINSIEEISESSVPLSSLISFAEYNISICAEKPFELSNKLKNIYENAKELKITKFNKKKIKTEKNILPLIRNAYFSADEKNVFIRCILSAKNETLLNPFLFAQSLFQKAELNFQTYDVNVLKIKTHP